MSKIKKYFQNDEIQLSFGLGICILLLAYCSKSIFPEPISYLENATPGIVFLFYEVVKGSKKIEYKYKRPLLWNTLMVLASAIIIVKEML